MRQVFSLYHALTACIDPSLGSLFKSAPHIPANIHQLFFDIKVTHNQNGQPLEVKNYAERFLLTAASDVFSYSPQAKNQTLPSVGHLSETIEHVFSVMSFFIYLSTSAS